MKQLAVCASEIQGAVDLGRGEPGHYPEEAEDDFGSTADPDPEMPRYDAPIASIPPRTDVRTESRVSTDPVRNKTDSGLPDHRGRQSRHSAAAESAARTSVKMGDDDLAYVPFVRAGVGGHHHHHQQQTRRGVATATSKLRATSPHAHLNGEGREHRGGIDGAHGRSNSGGGEPGSSGRTGCDNPSRVYPESEEASETPHPPFGMIRTGVGGNYTPTCLPSRNAAPASHHGHEPHLAAITHGQRDGAGSVVAERAQGQSSRGIDAGGGAAARGREDTAMVATTRGRQERCAKVWVTIDGDRTQQQQQQRDRRQQRNGQRYPSHNGGSSGLDGGGGGGGSGDGAPNGAQGGWSSHTSTANSGRSGEGGTSTSSGSLYLGGITTEPGGSEDHPRRSLPRESPHAGAKRSLDPLALTKSGLGYGSGVKRDHGDRRVEHGMNSTPGSSEISLQSSDLVQQQQQLLRSQEGSLRQPVCPSQTASSLLPALTGLSLEGGGTTSTDDAEEKQTERLDERKRS